MKIPKYIILENGAIADAADNESEALDAADDLKRMHPNSEVHVYTLTASFLKDAK
jgi:hypothetical protein